MEAVFESASADTKVMFDDPVDGAEGAEDVPVASHDRLLQNINLLDSKRAGRSMVQRSEAAAEASEFHVAAGSGAGVSVGELVASLGDRARHAGLRRELGRAARQKKLPPPLEKPEAVRIQRKAGYEKVTREVGRWENVVQQRRAAGHLSFPLNKPDMRVETGKERAAAFLPQTPLEQEIAALLGGSESVVPPGEVLSERERRALAAMSLDEALQRRKELAKHRALLTYQEAKHRRQNKIKSRKYRRVLKKERLKEHLREFERLKICDPEAALAKLQEAERQRVEERMSQRHRNTGKWARLQAIKRKYDPQAREALAENLRINRDLTQKTTRSEDGGDASSEDEEEQPSSAAAPAPAAEPGNPWMAGGGEEGPDAYGEGYTKFWTDQEAAKRRLREAERAEEEEEESAEEEDEEERPAPTVTAEDIAAEEDSGGEEEGGEEVLEKKAKKKKTLKRKAGGDGEKKKKKVKKVGKETKDIDAIFDSYEKTIAKKSEKKLKKLIGSEENSTAKKKTKKKGEKGAKKAKKTKNKQESGTAVSEDTAADSGAGKIDETAERRSTLADLEDLAGQKAGPAVSADELAVPTAPAPAAAPAPSAPELDPARFLAVEPRRLRSLRPDAGGEGGEDALDDADEARMTIAEAFADDDVVAEFREEKEATIDADKPKDIDMALPGWGDWGGQNIKISARKRRRLLFRAPKGPPRKDHSLGHVILSEKRSEALRAHQPSELPHYVSSVAAFEASIRAPVGRTWLPARAHQELTRPAVSTRAGTLIAPMDESALLHARRPRRKKQ